MILSTKEAKSKQTNLKRNSYTQHLTTTPQRTGANKNDKEMSTFKLYKSATISPHGMICFSLWIIKIDSL